MEITAAEFKAKCLKLMDVVAKPGQTITITKRDKPVPDESGLRLGVQSQERQWGNADPLLQRRSGLAKSDTLRT